MAIQFIDLCSGIGGFHSGLMATGHYKCVGHAEIDPNAAKAYKAIYGEEGGMHVHMILFKDGQPVFSDDNGYSHLSETAHYFIGGLLKHIGSLCAITNPSTNSFKRLIPGFEAPVTVDRKSVV